MLKDKEHVTELKVVNDDLLQTNFNNNKNNEGLEVKARGLENEEDERLAGTNDRQPDRQPTRTATMIHGFQISSHRTYPQPQNRKFMKYIGLKGRITRAKHFTRIIREQKTYQNGGKLAEKFEF